MYNTTCLCNLCDYPLEVEDDGDRLSFYNRHCPRCGTPTFMSQDAEEYWKDADRRYAEQLTVGDYYCDHCPFDFLDMDLITKSCDDCYFLDRKVINNEPPTLKGFMRYMMPKQKV